MKINIVTAFPNIFDSFFGESIIKRAITKGILEINIVDLRDFTTDKHKTIDKRPFSGGAGMLLMFEPIYKAVKSLEYPQYTRPEIFKTDTGKDLSIPNILKSGNHKKIADWQEAMKMKVHNNNIKTNEFVISHHDQFLKYPLTIGISPKGYLLNQNLAKQLAEFEEITLICGHYEGYDSRVSEHICDFELSIGEYILSGGETGVFVIVDTIVRLIQGSLGNDDSIKNESFS